MLSLKGPSLYVSPSLTLYMVARLFQTMYFIVKLCTAGEEGHVEDL